MQDLTIGLTPNTGLGEPLFNAFTKIQGNKVETETRLAANEAAIAAQSAEIILEADFLEVIAFDFKCPVNMKFLTQTSEGIDATLSIPLGTNMSQFQKLTITPVETGLIILKGIAL